MQRSVLWHDAGSREHFYLKSPDCELVPSSLGSNSSALFMSLLQNVQTWALGTLQTNGSMRTIRPMRTPNLGCAANPLTTDLVLKLIHQPPRVRFPLQCVLPEQQ